MYKEKICRRFSPMNQSCNRQLTIRAIKTGVERGRGGYDETNSQFHSTTVRHVDATHDLSITDSGEGIKISTSTLTNKENVTRTKRPQSRALLRARSSSEQGNPICSTATQQSTTAIHAKPTMSPTEPNEALRADKASRDKKGPRF